MAQLKLSELVADYYEILQSRTADWDRDRLRSLLATDLEFEGPIAGSVPGAERFIRGVAGFIETQRGLRFLQRIFADDQAAALYDSDLPGGTLRFAEFIRTGGGRIRSISLLYDPARYRELGGR